jgi:hypothetical protein
VETLKIAFLVPYLFLTLYFFTNWLKFFKGKLTWSVEDSFLAFIILVIATILWPFVVPVSLLEQLKAQKPQLSIMLVVVLAIVVVSLIALSGLAGFY